MTATVTTIRARTKAMAVLHAAERKKLPTKVFGLPEQRKYPLEDKAHARSALAYAKHDATPEDQKRIKSKVKRLFPSMKLKMDPSKMHGLRSMAA
jgi:hypothetical protein